MKQFNKAELEADQAAKLEKERAYWRAYFKSFDPSTTLFMTLNSKDMSPAQLKVFLAEYQQSILPMTDSNPNPDAGFEKKLKAIVERNQWLRDLQQKNPGKVLDLQNTPDLTPERLQGLGLLFQKSQYTKVIVADKVDQATLKTWIPVLRKSNVSTLVMNAQDAAPKTAHKARSMAYIEKGIRKIFGPGDFRFGRNTLWYALFGANFVYSLAGALMSPYALLWSGLGFAVLGGMRVASNYYFHHQLDKTKTTKGYWKESHHQDQYLAGRNAAKSYLTWFNYKSWTSNGYLGYTHAQHNIPSVLPLNEDKKTQPSKP